jgi:hypothetical protein
VSTCCITRVYRSTDVFKHAADSWTFYSVCILCTLKMILRPASCTCLLLVLPPSSPCECGIFKMCHSQACHSVCSLVCGACSCSVCICLLMTLERLHFTGPAHLACCACCSYGAPGKIAQGRPAMMPNWEKDAAAGALSSCSCIA